MDELTVLLGMAVQRLGGELHVTEAEWDAFCDAEYKIRVDFPDNGDTVVVLEANDLGEGVVSRVVMKDGTKVTIGEGE